MNFQVQVGEIDDEYTRGDKTIDARTYYTVAHSVSEIVTEQPQIMVSGNLKEYQVRSKNFRFYYADFFSPYFFPM